MDLLSSRPFWPIRDGLPATFPPLEGNEDCDVAIIGGGISGALTASLLASAGIDVVVLDRREVAHGSTAGNTGLVLYELDMMLHRLAERIGWEGARRAYRRCQRAVVALERLIRASGIDCDYSRRDSLLVAATPDHVPRLRREFDARARAGFEVEWWTRKHVASRSSLPHVAAILSPGAAELDVYRLTYALLLGARQAGARIYDRTRVTERIRSRQGVMLRTSRGPRVRARQMVVATGYETRAFLPSSEAALHSTFVIVSEPIHRGSFDGWPRERCLIWDTADPYLYLRTTSDGRAMIGGYDEAFSSAPARERLLRAKTTALKRRFRQFFPRIPLEVAASWAGTFGVSTDGLPFIGQHPRAPHTWFALGFGGNGTTFTMIAAEIIRDAMLGGEDPDAALFGFERLGV